MNQMHCYFQRYITIINVSHCFLFFFPLLYKLLYMYCLPYSPDELYFLFLPCLVGLAGRAKQFRSLCTSHQASQSIDSVDYIQYLAMSIHFFSSGREGKTFDDF